MTGIEYVVGVAGLSLSLGAVVHLLHKEYMDWRLREEYERGQRIFRETRGRQEPVPLVTFKPRVWGGDVYIVEIPSPEKARITKDMIPECARVKDGRN